jgi:hypothetical protein
MIISEPVAHCHEGQVEQPTTPHTQVTETHTVSGIKPQTPTQMTADAGDAPCCYTFLRPP